jgi:hypothetical protein
VQGRFWLGEADLKKNESSWFRLLAFCFTTSLVVALAFAAFMTTATLAFAGSGQSAEVAPSGDYTGIISDSMCGARHVKHPNLDSANCTRECVRTGAKYKLIDGDKSYFLQGDFAALAQFAGERAKITGTLNGETIKVSAINPI